MDRRTFLATCGALGLYGMAFDTAFAKTITETYAANRPYGCMPESVDVLSMLSTCPAACLKEIHGVLNEEALIGIELDDLRYLLAGATCLGYLSGSASGSGSSAMQDVVKQTMPASATFHGVEKLLVMLTLNQSFLRLRDIEILHNNIAKYVGEEANVIFGTINDERMLEDEVRLGILVPYTVTF